MTSPEVLSKLKSLGNAKMCALHKKNGAGDNLFGVKLGDIRTVAKPLGKNNQLARELWKTGNVDARLLATLIIDVKKLKAEELEEMVHSLDLPQLSDWLNSYVIKDHADKESLRKKWMTSKHPWAARAGWSLTAGRVARDSEGLDLEALLDRIEKEMPKASPVVQWTMNTTLAYIGIHHRQHRKRALEIGEKMGIYRDYPVSKGCTSPFAPIWINEMVKRAKELDA
jgi:3-methyladenine DNA glycosylase AlkD